MNYYSIIQLNSDIELKYSYIFTFVNHTAWFCPLFQKINHLNWYFNWNWKLIEKSLWFLGTIMAIGKEVKKCENQTQKKFELLTWIWLEIQIDIIHVDLIPHASRIIHIYQYIINYINIHL